MTNNHNYLGFNVIKPQFQLIEIIMLQWAQHSIFTEMFRTALCNSGFPDSNCLQTVLGGQGKYKMCFMCIFIGKSNCHHVYCVEQCLLVKAFGPLVSLWFLEELLIYWTWELFLWGRPSNQAWAGPSKPAKPLAAWCPTAGPHTRTFDAKNAAEELRNYTQ